jgi:hypothetical protein
VNFGISPAFEYVQMVEDWFWPAMAFVGFGLALMGCGCGQRG